MTKGVGVKEVSQASLRGYGTDAVWVARFEDLERHLDDLWVRRFEGAQSRGDREALFRRGFELVSPLARTVLKDMARHFLSGAGSVRAHKPSDDGAGGLIGWWSLSWAEQRQAHDRRNGEPLEPVRLVAALPEDYLHPHFMAPMPGLPFRVVAWPFQVLTPSDVRRQEPVLRVLAEAILHERIYQCGLGWRLFGRKGVGEQVPRAPDRFDSRSGPRSKRG